ncbi:MAG: ATP-dependent helicase [Janthinobacterium lividum]
MPPLPPAFAAELARLNERQREAVLHPEGPLLVVAGPGTGKTQLLAARVAWLLLQPDARPQEILCLTYTDAAARNMRQRLLRFIGPAAHRVAIHTFHSLGQLIIQENAELLGQHDLTAASDMEADELLRGLVDHLPVGHPLRRDTGSVYYDLPHLKDLFQRMKREGWQAAELLAELEEYRLGLPYDEHYLYLRPSPAMQKQGVRVGDVKQQELAAEEDKIAKSVAAIELFAAYQAALHRHQRYDYDDMLGWATALLTGHEHLRLSYQERFQHFLVDEFQDTNGAQSHLLHLLADYWDTPSVLVVGDDDQSIFRFQGASVSNVLNFRQRYAGVATVVLEENYRSSGPVLAAAQGLIARNEERLTRQVPGLSKQLVARHPLFSTATRPPLLRRYATPLHEAANIAAELASLYHGNRWPEGGVGIIARNHDQLDLLAQLLREAGVPFYRKRPVNVLTAEPLAASLYRVLSYLAAALRPDPSAAEPALFAVLHLDCLAVPPADLVRLAAGHQQRRRQAQGTGRAAPPWRAWAETAAHDDATAAALNISNAGRTALHRALALLDEWVQATASLPLPGLLERVLLPTLLPAALGGHPQPTHLLAVAQTLLQFARREARRRPTLSVAELLHIWDTLATTREGLPLEQASGSESARLELLTAHGAKGLEWERVWLLGSQQHKWLPKQRKGGFRLPPARAALPSEESEAEEARRLFFVALTRAQHHLCISWATADDAGKELAECEFVTELQEDGLVPKDVEVPAETLAAARRAQLAPPPPPAPIPDPALLQEVLADFALSITTLNAYLACPIACYYERLLGVPVPQTEPLIYGLAVHGALEHHFRQAQRQGTFGTDEELAQGFVRRLARFRPDLSAPAFGRLLNAGQQQLRAWWAHWQPSARPSAVAEYTVYRARLPGGLLLTGQIDRLDVQPDGYRCDVLDYKTGTQANAAAQLRAAPARAVDAGLLDWHQDERLRGGDYWRQGIFYHLLLTHDLEQRFTPLSVSFDFIQPQETPGRPPLFERRKIVLTPADEATVLAQIREVDAAIRRHDFAHGCGECAWCKLRKIGELQA